MTNEQLALLIKNGGNNKYIPVLWKNIQTLINIKADKYYYAMTDKFKAYGIDIGDLRQELYFAFLEAINAYNAEKKLKFVTFLEFPIKNTIYRIFNNRQEKYNPLNTAESLDKSLSDSNDISLSEIIEDKKCNIFDTLEKHSKAEIIRNEVDKLNDTQKRIIKLYYFHDKADCEIAKKLCTTSSNIFQIRRASLANLKKAPILNFIYYY